MPISSKTKSTDLTADRLPPRLPAVPLRERTCVTVFGGVSSDSSAPWSIADMKDLSPRAYPSLATRRYRELLTAASGTATGHGMLVVDKDLYLVRGATLYRIRDALHASRGSAYVESLGTVADSDKQMVVFGDYLLIFPDKKYIRLSTGTMHAMDLDTGILESVDFNGTRITLPDGYTWTGLGFLPGDSIHVINEDDINPAPEGYYRLREVHGSIGLIYGTFPVLTHCIARVRREVPALSMAAVFGNRLFGSDGTDIYIGAEESPFAFQGKQADGRGAATVKTNTPGALTACVSWQGYMVFFKSASICRILGNRADSFMLQESPAAGLPADMVHTLCELGGELYYYGQNGAFRYASVSQKPERIGLPLATAPIRGCGGTDGVGYYLDLAEEGEGGDAVWRRCLYMPRGSGKSGEWYFETITPVSASASLGGFICTQAVDGRMWISRCDGRSMGYSVHEGTLWGELRSSVTFHPDYTHEPDGYRPISICLRATHKGEDAGELRLVASFADGRSGTDAAAPTEPDFRMPVGFPEEEREPEGRVELACFRGRMTDRLLRVPLTVPHCDHMILALEMIGDWEIHAMVLEYERVRR